MIFGPTIRRRIPNCWPGWNRNSWRSIRPEVRLSPDPQFPDLAAFLPSAHHSPRGRRELRLLPASPPRRRGARRRDLRDHRHHRNVHQRDPGALHVHPRRTSAASACPTAASPAPSSSSSAARPATRAWKRSAITASPPRNAPHAERQPRGAKDRTEPRVPVPDAQFQGRPANRHRPIPDDLSRPPTTAELEAVSAYGRSGNLKPREAVIDLAWALMNSAEFLYRH